MLMIKILVSGLFALGIIVLVGALVLPKHVIYKIKDRVISETDSLQLIRFTEVVKIEDIEQNDYVSKYKDIAINEMKRTGIPASIKLAQGLLESASGTSRIARESNNHFGMKCNSKCKGCTCRNYSSDEEFDMFRVFDSVKDSYEAHSELLLRLQRYRRLLDCPDYKCWAYGLKKANYATDPLYAKKLIKLIETEKLYLYDIL